MYTSVSADRQKNLVIHLNTHFKIRSYKCSFCDDRFYKANNVRIHEEATHDKIENRYKCKKCDFQTYSRWFLCDHNLTSHANTKYITKSYEPRK